MGQIRRRQPAVSLQTNFALLCKRAKGRQVPTAHEHEHDHVFVATLFTTTLVGAHMQYNFDRNLPFFDLDQLSQIFTAGLRSVDAFAAGLPFSLTLLTILMAH